MKTNCLKCKKEFQTYPCRLKSGRSQFCSRECRKKTIDRACSVCGFIFQIISWQKRQTCSKKCRYELSNKSQPKKRPKQCQMCQKDFYGTGRVKYCSTHYFGKGRKTVFYRCMDCGEEVSPVKSVVRCRKCAAKFISGENHPNWIHDRSSLSRVVNYGERRSYMYANWRKQVWLRDNFKCKIANPDCGGRVEAHHILGWASYPELRYEVNNGITLCHAHHPKKRAEEKRLIPFFQELVPVSSAPSSA